MQFALFAPFIYLNPFLVVSYFTFVFNDRIISLFNCYLDMRIDLHKQTTIINTVYSTPVLENHAQGLRRHSSWKIFQRNKASTLLYFNRSSQSDICFTPQHAVKINIV